MRRCVSVAATTPTAAIVTAWRDTAPVMGALATWQSAYFHSSKFIGRKSGRSKKLGAGASTSSTTTAASLPVPSSITATAAADGGALGSRMEAAGGDGPVGEARTREHNVAVPAASASAGVSSSTTPVDPSASTTKKGNNDNNTRNASSAVSAHLVSGKGGAQRMKKTRVPHQRDSMQKLTDSAASPEQEEDAMPFRKQESTNLSRSVTHGDVSVELEEDVVVERASITKLFMLSDSVASIFCALPQNQRSIDNYLREVDQAVLPPLTPEHRVDEIGNLFHRDGNYAGSNNEVVARREIAERVLSEERANHTLCIHVRDMDQLVPPPHLLLESATKTPSKTSLTGGARRRKVSRVEKKSGVVRTTTLTPIERLLALHEWQIKALQKARESQERFKVPEDYHAITRVRFHDPPKADLTVVQGSGCAKTVADVIATMDGKLNSDMNAEDNKDDEIFNQKQAVYDENGTTLLSKPFAFKPLLSVVASCIPRREPTLGSRCEEEVFFSSRSPSTNMAATTAMAKTRKTKKIKGADAATTKIAGAAKMGEELLGRRVPPMPRFTTRVTVLVEHDELEPMDLLSMAERITTRKDDVEGRTSASSRKKRVPRIYCHIADGGEY
ncbi:hypothetical protein TraAM80_02372 [Trypanosoma rangeli]|uniref:Uncharacterized protein n=1 Tax=Trypanosoma rangeli TaxID=5698 RepID=A0A3R7NNC3_TRYRA|nr:uncharacterized protein TraAM80_02372 [Trypanosoma rangeli]RNF08964.1 hypothetical protein TraAM80_02372 [Trypanosoma rangeli]|eukprot:RNF08964.1 hypothetical protein TraAM80_02372 [Trypanosoma rangeli]